ncbi:MAG: GNAT family N-acetyltransferase [bacterium]|nr:GNAT family N-acetyltransferase [bacterium]
MEIRSSDRSTCPTLLPHPMTTGWADFIIDKNYQRLGYGRAALLKMLSFVPYRHDSCQVIQLTVEKENTITQRLYKSLGFSDSGRVNKYGEIVYRLPISRG